MNNYYDILGLSSTAGIREIKAAFRHLAKLYHPDVNPKGKEEFSQILKAYETLSDVKLKAAYDRKLEQQLKYGSQKEKAPPTTKNWRYDERELKRRRYYDEHIKQYEKKTAATVTEVESKVRYNEFKYILFATPLAVIIFLAIMSVASKRKLQPDIQPPAASIESTPARDHSDLKLGDAPYSEFFGRPIYDNSRNGTLLVKNLSGADVVVCLFTKRTFVRDFFIKDGFSAEVSQLPTDSLSINYSSGLQFNSSRKINGGRVSGAFTSQLRFYESLNPVSLSSINELTLLKGTNHGFRAVDEREFFTK